MSLKFSNDVKKREGYVALMSVLIISAVLLIISVGLSLRSINEASMSLGEQESRKALAMADLCMEKALMKLESVLNYAGNESIILGDKSCDILTVSGNGNFNRTVQTQGTVSNYTKKIKVEVSQISPIMQILSWEEVAEF